MGGAFERLGGVCIDVPNLPQHCPCPRNPADRHKSKAAPSFISHVFSCSACPDDQPSLSAFGSCLSRAAPTDLLSKEACTASCRRGHGARTRKMLHMRNMKP